MKKITGLRGVIGAIFMLLCLVGIKHGANTVYAEVNVYSYNKENNSYCSVNNFEGAHFDKENSVLTLENYKGAVIEIEGDGEKNDSIVINVKGHNVIDNSAARNIIGADNGGPKREKVSFGNGGFQNSGYYTYQGWLLWIRYVDVKIIGDGTIDFLAGENNDIGVIDITGSKAILDGPTINCFDLRSGFCLCDTKFVIKSGELNIYNAPEITVNRDKETEKILQSYFYYRSSFIILRAELDVQGGKLNISYVYPEGNYGNVKICNPGHTSTWFVNFDNTKESMDPVFEEGDGITYVFENPDLINIVMPEKIKSILGSSEVKVAGKTFVIKDKLKNDEAKNEDNKKNEDTSKTDVKSVEKGSIIKDKKYIYKVLLTGSADGKKAGKVRVLGFNKKSLSTVKIASKVKIDGVVYKVTEIGKNAFKKNKKIRKVIIGKYVSKIDKGAFAGCKKLKVVNIKSKRLKIVGNKAFYKNAKKIKFKFPKGKKKVYRALLIKAKCVEKN